MGAAAPPHVDTAFLVCVDLIALSRNLADRFGEPFDARKAARWLTQTVHSDGTFWARHGKATIEEHSPFRPTDDWGVFYSEEDPRVWLEDDEVRWVKTVEPTRRLIVRTRKLRVVEGAVE